MNKKERALHVLESELDSISQSIYCSKECYKCRFLSRLHKLQGAVRILMDYGTAPKNTTLTHFQIQRWGAGKKRAGHNNQRVHPQTNRELNHDLGKLKEEFGNREEFPEVK